MHRDLALVEDDALLRVEPRRNVGGGNVADRLPQLGSRAAYAKQAINDKLLEHKQYIAQHGDDMPEITGWRWGQGAMKGQGTSTEGDNV